MRTLMIAVVTVAALTLAGCYVQTVHPLYTDDSLVFDPGLAGTWLDDDDPGEPTVIEAAGENAYTVTLKEKNGDERYDAHLVQLGETLFLDMCPAEKRRKSATDDFLPLHILMRIERRGDDLYAASMDFEWLEAKIDAGELDIDHFRYDGRIILLDGNEKLQRTMMALDVMDGAFEEPSLLRRAR